MKVTLPNRGINSLATVGGASTTDKDSLRQITYLDLQGNKISTLAAGFEGPSMKLSNRGRGGSMDDDDNDAEVDVRTKSKSGTSALESMPNLHFLNLSRNALADDLRGIAPMLQGASQLTEIDVSTNQLTSLKGLEWCEKLTKLNVSGNCLVNLDFLPRDGPPGLIVNAEKNRLKSLKDCWRRTGPRIAVLNVGLNRLEDFQEAVLMARNSVELQELSIYGNPFLVNGNVLTTSADDGGDSEASVYQFVENQLAAYVKTVLCVDPRVKKSSGSGQQERKLKRSEMRDTRHANALAEQGSWPKRESQLPDSEEGVSHLRNMSLGLPSPPKSSTPAARKSAGQQRRGDPNRSHITARDIIGTAMGRLKEDDDDGGGGYAAMPANRRVATGPNDNDNPQRPEEEEPNVAPPMNGDDDVEDGTTTGHSPSDDYHADIESWQNQQHHQQTVNPTVPYRQPAAQANNISVYSTASTGAAGLGIVEASAVYNELQRAKAEIKKLKQEMASMKTTMSDAASHLRTLKKENDELATANAELRREVKKKQKENEYSREQLKAAMTKMEVSNTRLVQQSAAFERSQSGSMLHSSAYRDTSLRLAEDGHREAQAHINRRSRSTGGESKRWTRPAVSSQPPSQQRGRTHQQDHMYSSQLHQRGGASTDSNNVSIETVTEIEELRRVVREQESYIEELGEENTSLLDKLTEQLQKRAVDLQELKRNKNSQNNSLIEEKEGANEKNPSQQQAPGAVVFRNMPAQQPTSTTSPLEPMTTASVGAATVASQPPSTNASTVIGASTVPVAGSVVVPAAAAQEPTSACSSQPLTSAPSALVAPPRADEDDQSLHSSAAGSASAFFGRPPSVAGGPAGLYNSHHQGEHIYDRPAAY